MLRPRFLNLGGVLSILTLVCVGLLSASGPTVNAQGYEGHRGPPLSGVAEMARSGKLWDAEAGQPGRGYGGLGGITLSGEALGSSFLSDQTIEPLRERPKPPAPRGVANVQVNQDFSYRPQNEPSIAINPRDPNNIVVGMNDYRNGTPVGGGAAASFDGGQTWVDGFPPMPLLIGFFDDDSFIIEPPAGTGDPAVVFDNNGIAYYTSLGFSFTYCHNGIFLFRSPNGGQSWTRPIVPPLGDVRTVVYHDDADSCFEGHTEPNIFHDKEYLTIDNSGGPHDGRLYVTWTRFDFTGGAYLESPIYLAYSDDQGDTWNIVGEINGSSPTLCEHQDDTTLDATPHDCDENQFSYPVVGSDGTVYVHFFNEQNESEWRGGGEDGTGTGEFDDQILVVAVDPDTWAIDGPHQVSMVADGLTNYPFNSDDQQTLCNSNFRVNAAGNIGIGPDDELYVVWADNRNGDEFPFATSVDDAPPYACPDGLKTDTDVFISKSIDGGRTWSPPAQINDDGPGSDQWFPWVTVGDQGQVGVVFHDRRLDPNNKLTDTWLAHKRSTSRTWTNQRLSVESSNMDNAFSDGVFIGDYNSLAAQDGAFYGVFTDARNADLSTPLVGVPWNSDIVLGTVHSPTR